MALNDDISKIVDNALSQLKTANGSGIMHMGTAKGLLELDIAKLITTAQQDRIRFIRKDLTNYGVHNAEYVLDLHVEQLNDEAARQ